MTTYHINNSAQQERRIEALESALIKIEFGGYFHCGNCEKLSAIARIALRPNQRINEK